MISLTYRLDFAKATQKLHISREQVKTTLLNWLDRSAMERVSVELDATKKGVQRCRVLTTTTESKFVNAIFSFVSVRESEEPSHIHAEYVV